MQICLIGPSHPFRGGLAHHTTLLYRHLRGRHDVTFYTFRRLYPRWFYPGKTNRDVSEVPLCEDGMQPLLDYLNPLTWWNVYRRIRSAQPDLLIVPWWSSFWAPHFWMLSTLVKRFCTTKILFICHNAVDHESYSFSRMCTRTVLKQGDYLFVHSETDGNTLREMLPASSITRVFHPIYDFFHRSGISKTDARRQLGLTGDVLLFFGFIRPYKGLDILLEGMPLILAQRPVTLLVVGEFWEGRERYLRRIEELGIREAVKIVEGYIPNEQVEPYFAAADLVVLPYVAGTSSGIVQVAYGCDRPVIATQVGCLPEVVEDGKTGYVVPPNTPQAIAAAVVRFFVEQKEQEFRDHIRVGKARFSWHHLVDQIERVVATDASHEPIEAERVEGV